MPIWTGLMGGHPKQHIASSTAPESAQPWTATRCHRLLRPLLAHIAALRKDKERRDLIGAGSGSAAISQTAKPRRTVLGKRSYPGSDSDYNDKKICRKYSSKASRRRSSSEHSSTPQRNAQKQRRQPGNRGSQDVVLPTPFLRRVRNHLPSSPSQAPDEPFQEAPAQASKRCSHLGACCKTRCVFETELAGLRSSIDGERHGLYESVFKAFDSLLRVTSPRKNQAAGPKSLLAMCLRKVPACVAALEEWERGEARENATKSTLQGAGTSFEIYSELEALGAVDGWKHLCLLVRAHGVQIVQDAAAEGLLEDPVADLLIRVSLEYMPATECRSLIDTFVMREYPKPRSADDDLFTSSALQPLRILRCCDTSGVSVMSGVLSDLLADGRLPPDWILTKSFVSLWPSIVRLVTEMKPCGDTVDLVATTLELLCDLATPKKPRGIPQTRLRGKPQTTLISAVAALGSVVLLSEEGSSQCGGKPTTRAATLRRRIEYVVNTCTARLKRRKKGGRKLGTYLLALCSFLSLEADSASAAMVEASWKGVQNCRGNEGLMLQYDATTALMSAIAHYCGRGTGLAPNVYLSQFCDKLETLQLPGGALNNMRVDGAFRLVEHTGDLRDLAFAETLRASAAVCATTPEQTRGKKASSFSGIRWDDGISEWVAATPATDLAPAARGPRRRSGEERRCAVGSGQEDTDDSASETDGVDSGSAADDESDDVSETHDDTLSPNTEASPGPFSDGVDGEKLVPDPIPESDVASGSDPELGGGGPESSPAPAAPASPQRPPTTTKPSPAPPPPAGGFLAARPKRLSRRLALSRAGDDELAFDGGNNDSEAENWLTRNKPARFLRAAAAAPVPPARVGTAAGAAKRGIRRVARASLVYLRRRRVETRPATTATAAVTAAGRGLAEEESDDELSFL
ncbi:hypothetical protein BT67DRAFT_432000 [Trichocladium antarcticum]|uniref:Uncharacterized protein n=1 Tax=Trichocladium antarcticum TaxID=1450529 RepID=A0AAN6URE3_9PEZI|nr:hypothetical protein BT67DRAFT_432000 [Trichocladium antarcticum]